MASDLKETFEKSCRLCAKVKDVTLMIFSAEGEAMFFQRKLSKYLLLEVEEDDNLPNNICIDCCSKLYSVCDFIDTVHESQKTLLSLQILLDKVQTPVCEKIQLANETTTNISMQVIQGDVSSDLAPLYGLDAENVTIKLINERECLKTKYCEQNEMLWAVHLKNMSSNILNDNKHDKEVVNKDKICYICKKEFVKKIDRIKHQRIHSNNTICQDCGRHFRTTGNLMSHMVMHIKKVNGYYCNICGKKFTTLGGLKAHNVSHSTERPFGCEVCKKTFKRSHELKSHMNSHTGRKPYKCQYCDKAFSSSTNCYLHRRRKHPEHFYKEKSNAIHSSGHLMNTPGQEIEKDIIISEDINQDTINNDTITENAEKPEGNNVQHISSKLKLSSPKTAKAKLKCGWCSHTFHSRDNYNYHIYKHTGDKPFNCSYCSETFVTRKGLLIHHNQKHPKNIRPLALLSRNLLLM